MPQSYDAVVVGSGPNGLSAAITIARAGLSVVMIEGKETIGGGMRSGELTLPGFIHDICSTVHALGVASPFMRSQPLEELGLEWVHPPAPLAHPLDGEPAMLLERSPEETGRTLAEDNQAYQKLMEPLSADWEKLMDDFLGPLPFPPQHLLTSATFGLKAIRSVSGLAKSRFDGKRARALFAGLGAHSIMPLEWPATAAFGLMLGLVAHAAGWPVARGGSQKVAEALAARLLALGGEIVTGQMVNSLDELPPSKAVLLDVTPRQFLRMAGDRLPDSYQRRLARYRYGPGVFKIDYALDGPIPWKDPAVSRAGTVHLGGTLEEIAAGERTVWQGEHPQRPFVLLVQASLFDASRAPTGKHTCWAYCHVPNGSSVDMTAVIEAQIERFAPGFRDLVLGRAKHNALEVEAYNPNYVGGDINGGVQDLRQLFTRPAPQVNPYTTPLNGVYLCSSATPPGGGVHGMCGFYAAATAIAKLHI